MAKSASEALKKEAKHKADDVWVDDEWMKNNLNTGSSHWGYGKKKD